ncbi:MAG: hypothetical protein VX642_04080 [Bdellovibrionota bacterium]|nr:hypothetical protein [Bdellovibrionota bacterium]
MKILLITLLVLWHEVGHSYSIKNHEYISTLSIELLEYCGITTALDGKTIVDFSGREDSSPHHASLITRLTNWHFYTNQKKEDDWIFSAFLRRDFWKRWNFLMDEIENNKLQKNEFSALTGAIAHYIQDVSNPSHVIPVYHGPGLKDEFDSYPILADKIRSTFSENCSSLETNPQNIFEILEQTAKNSLNAIEEKTLVFLKDGKQHESSFKEAFWYRAADDDNFFGKYGSLGNNYGKSEFSFPIWRRNQKVGPKKTIKRKSYDYKINAEVFKEFSQQQQTKAVLSTAKMILIMNEVYNNKND